MRTSASANKNTDEQFKKAVAFEDKLHIALGQRDDLDIRNKQLAEQVAKARQVLQTAGLTIETSKLHRPSADRCWKSIRRIAPKVPRHRQRAGEGHMLEAFRGDKYLGRMQC